MYYCTFGSGSVQDVSDGVVESDKRDACGNLFTGYSLTSLDVSWVVLAEGADTFDEEATLLLLDGENPVHDVPLPSNNSDDLLAVEVNAEDDWALWEIPPPGAIDIRSSLSGDSSAIGKKCPLYSLGMHATAGCLSDSFLWYGHYWQACRDVGTTSWYMFTSAIT